MAIFWVIFFWSYNYILIYINQSFILYINLNSKKRPLVPEISFKAKILYWILPWLYISLICHHLQMKVSLYSNLFWIWPMTFCKQLVASGSEKYNRIVRITSKFKLPLVWKLLAKIENPFVNNRQTTQLWSFFIQTKTITQKTLAEIYE